MKIFVLSDTHGRIEKAIEIYRSLQDIDLIIHLGDFWNDAKKMKDQLNVSVLSVKGNMDGSFSKDGYHILETEFGKIYLAHGHMESVKQSLENIMYKAESLECKAVFFGHTHIPMFRQVEGMYLLNPGSLTLPVGGRKGSYAIASIAENSLDATILFEDAPQIQKTNSGLIKSLLNDSDRF
ncbi:MAG: metallophosphoesterase [Bacillota bacterium]